MQAGDDFKSLRPIANETTRPLPGTRTSSISANGLPWWNGRMVEHEQMR